MCPEEINNTPTISKILLKIHRNKARQANKQKDKTNEPTKYHSFISLGKTNNLDA